jgi:hypothetical protein
LADSYPAARKSNQRLRQAASLKPAYPSQVTASAVVLSG